MIGKFGKILSTKQDADIASNTVAAIAAIAIATVNEVYNAELTL
ncbi:hypothetical protein OF897_20755 [Chryseobacterium formosus]|uniref:Variable large protein n=1 Tax=Chryseobacterium formosus TaxID=1537363 RepID=A0ABT3XXF3_9FLAO|nr:hypothetical protein [Chryseobacterium formosus]MCX8526351.1 hypothetical protein [Chryseobacterium formosus]